MVFTSRDKIFFKYWSPSDDNNGFKENMNERISLPINRKSVAGDSNKGFVQNIFSRDKKPASSRKHIWGICFH